MEGSGWRSRAVPGRRGPALGNRGRGHEGPCSGGGDWVELREAIGYKDGVGGGHSPHIWSIVFGSKCMKNNQQTKKSHWSVEVD